MGLRTPEDMEEGLEGLDLGRAGKEGEEQAGLVPVPSGWTPGRRGKHVGRASVCGTLRQEQGGLGGSSVSVYLCDMGSLDLYPGHSLLLGHKT
jgi:hypothetical protein